MSFTKGPWTEAEYCEGTIKGLDNISVAYTSDRFRTKQEFEANIRLICASPDLLSAVEHALSEFKSPHECNCDSSTEGDYPCYFHRIEGQLRAALKKATGGL
jgi:hypothetical protein